MQYQDEYSDWAQDYDLFGEIEHENVPERDFLDGILKENGVKTVLDCACGTGQHLIMLSKLGYQMHGSDYSDAMLKACQKNLSAANLKTPLKQCDYRKLEDQWTQKFDAVLCLTQAINHMLTKEDLVLALTSMRNRLNENGVLILTQGTTQRTLQDKFRFSPVVNNKDFSRILIRDVDGEEQTIHVLDLFHSDGKNAMERHEIRIKIILDEEFNMLLKEAGFSKVEIFGGYDRQPYDKETSWKLIIVAKN